MPGDGAKSQNLGHLQCAVYNVNISSLRPYLKNDHGDVFLDHRYPVEFAFIPCHHVLGTISRVGLQVKI